MALVAITRGAVLAAIAEYDQLGQEGFLHRSGVLGMTFRAAGQNLERLVAVGILREIPGTGRTRRLFIAPEVLNAIGEGRPELDGT